MAKTRLINVDEIVTSGGGEVDLTAMAIFPHAVDGHSPDASHVMFAGGRTGSNVNTCDMKQFSTSANAAGHGGLTVARYALAAGSGNA